MEEEDEMERRERFRGLVTSDAEKGARVLRRLPTVEDHQRPDAYPRLAGGIVQDDEYQRGHPRENFSTEIEQPHQLRSLHARFQEETGKKVSMVTLRRALKKKIGSASSVFGIH